MAVTGKLYGKSFLSIFNNEMQWVAAAAASTVNACSVQNPTVLTTSAAHNLRSGDTITITASTGITPSLNGEHKVIVLTTTTLSIPVNVTASTTPSATITKKGDVFKTMLTTSTYVPDQDVHDYKDDVTNEVTGTGYTATGAEITTRTITYTGGTNKIMLDGDDVTWASSTITARNAVVYNSTPATDATRPLLCYQASDADVASNNGNFTVQWAAAGIVEITVS